VKKNDLWREEILMGLLIISNRWLVFSWVYRCSNHHNHLEGII
jgi:hypothetical protein